MKNSNKGVTIIALIITVVVLLALSVVVIRGIQGKDILGFGRKAKKDSMIAEEKEIITSIFINSNLQDEGNNLKDNLVQKLSKIENTLVSDLGEKVEIYYKDSGNLYYVDENGNITEADPAIIKEDDVAGALEGTGTEKDPFVIMSIEDLVWLANQVNSGTNTYIGEWVALGKPLDFKSAISYKDVETTYSYDETSNSYIPDESSETTLMELCTTGTGFIPIGTYYGSFEGNNYTISNIYVNTSGAAGLFSVVSGTQKYGASTIRNLTIEGKIITSTTNNTAYAGGIAGSVGDSFGYRIENCVNKAEVNGTSAGGIVGYCRGGNKLEIDSCVNSGVVKGNGYAGGIIGFLYTGKSITNCVNTAKIGAVTGAGGIVRLFKFSSTYSQQML